MNILKKFNKKLIDLVVSNQKTLEINETNDFKGVLVEVPPEEINYHLSCNICLILAKINNKNPINLANKVKELIIKNFNEISKVEVAGPGFLNLNLSKKDIVNFFEHIFESNSKYGEGNSKKKYNIEFVSANPTGPMHVGHCRGAIFGDVLANLLKFNGNKVTKEYYINDYGNQIKNFTKSIYLRIRELKFKEKFPQSQDLYPGEYIIDIAKKIIEENKTLNYEDLDTIYPTLSNESLKYSMKMIKEDLKNLGIKHDNFISESAIVKENLVEKTVNKLKNESLVIEGYLEPPKGEDKRNWKRIKRLIFKSTIFGDDSDRALQKNDGTWTYFANDVAYHSNKIERNFDGLINILGADHTGYIKRISAAVNALSKNKVTLNCKVCQLVKLYKNGKPFKMSKRAGDFVATSDLLKEVNKDSIRFMMLNRSNDVELDFHFDKVLEKNKDNPVFYVQYCQARINSLFRTLNLNIDHKIKIDHEIFKLNDYENKILKKILNWPKVIESSCIKYEPHRIPFYLYDLSTLFHSYWSKGNEDKNYKFIIDGKLKNINSLVILKVVSIVIKNGMNILGVSLPNKM
tara:strand:+ start:7356 stop:9080 length:1725 start_codon:yes stop_codon:yes gene_type:complete